MMAATRQTSKSIHQVQKQHMGGMVYAEHVPDNLTGLITVQTREEADKRWTDGLEPPP